MAASTDSFVAQVPTSSLLPSPATEDGWMKERFKEMSTNMKRTNEKVWMKQRFETMAAKQRVVGAPKEEEQVHAGSENKEIGAKRGRCDFIEIHSPSSLAVVPEKERQGGLLSVKSEGGNCHDREGAP
mmetsp:Transcript_48165/g.96980  ORF Transcript_48165/g.96980 Transcript_48165/m.96980 type:complete len:128 (-) Transcript_48165:138-521(-)|eukprot:CAMPEP_0171600270 /NCGR_PEP_ID=MMETSP0990-20121206/4220_1 /TAXON_ID=483369 /ORGANISM="non described non described, Strain CCMP2098" /LENGTH=127 /DNA_ID=CAMNT_0012162189 /DNA_START=63 /DNA_END=446 /DNA_ORIENTATION=+